MGGKYPGNWSMSDVVDGQPQDVRLQSLKDAVNKLLVNFWKLASAGASCLMFPAPYSNRLPPSQKDSNL